MHPEMMYSDEMQLPNWTIWSLVGMLWHLGVILYERICAYILALLPFAHPALIGAGDASDDNSSQNSEASSMSASGDREHHRLHACPSNAATVKTEIGSGSDLYDRESDIEYNYPNPLFIIGTPPPSDSEPNLFQRSASQNALR